jgi:carboxyl-terminal processing protease
LIESVDDVSVSGLAHEEVIDALRGEPGSVARVELKRDGKLMKVHVVREVIRPKLVTIKRFGADALYIRISRFHSSLVVSRLSSEVRSALAAQPRPKLWVLDLRFNPGGALSEVVATASLFVPSGTPLFSVTSRTGPKTYTASPPNDIAVGELRDALARIPLVVLVDGGTGSGAEALVRVLREHLSARVVGEPTAQIDNVLQTFDLRGEASVQITVGHIVSASDQRRHTGGVPLDLLLATTLRGEFGDIAEDALLAATLERFAK